MKKIILFVVLIVSFGSTGVIFAQQTPEITPPVTPTFTSCDPSQDNCYQLLEPLPQADGTLLEGLSLGTEGTGEQVGLGGFINLLFEIGIGVAGVLGVVMLVIYGFQYALGDKANIANLDALKTKVTNVVIGLLLLLGTFIILRTINPDLTLVEPEIQAVVLTIPDRSLNEDFLSNLDSVDVSQIAIDPSDFSNELFLAYLSHQQGAAGAASILWAANKGYGSVPNKTPFVRSASIINRNMKNNVGRDYTAVSGFTSVTPVGFLTYWAKKVEGFNRNPVTVSGTVTSALQTASQKTGVAYKTLLVICSIESRCNPNARNNSYYGLFQMGTQEFRVNGGTGDIYNPVSNAISAGNYMRKNITTVRGWWNTIIR